MMTRFLVLEVAFSRVHLWSPGVHSSGMGTFEATAKQACILVVYHIAGDLHEQHLLKCSVARHKHSIEQADICHDSCL